jgi:hypothetical protein
MRLIKLTLAVAVTLGCPIPSLRADDLKTHAESPTENARLAVPFPIVPDGYDLATISRAPAVVVPGLEPDRHDSNASTVLSINPSADMPPAATIEWSGYVQMGVVFRKGSAQ